MKKKTTVKKTQKSFWTWTRHPSDWKPRRRGHVYCSHACGMGCSWESYQKAHRDGKALAKSLGAHWKSNVWENLGWHHSAISACGQIEVHVHGSHSFWANIMGGDRHRQYAASARTPRSAVIAAVTKAVADKAAIEKMLDLLSSRIQILKLLPAKLQREIYPEVF